MSERPQPEHDVTERTLGHAKSTEQSHFASATQPAVGGLFQRDGRQESRRVRRRARPE